MVIPSKRVDPLSFDDAFAVKSAQGWLALGIVDEAERELRKLKRSAALHPDALKVFRQLQRALVECSNWNEESYCGG